jgi:hypothetical protein
MQETHHIRNRMMSDASVVLGIWVMICSFMLPISSELALNGAVTGAAITLRALAGISPRQRSVRSWAIALLAAWVAMSPWYLGGVRDDLRTWNLVIAGVLSAGLETFSLILRAIRYPWAPGRRPVH